MLNILSGISTANIVSFPFKEGELLDQGDWVMFDAQRVTKHKGKGFMGLRFTVMPVYAGNKDFYDTQALGRVDCVTAKSGVLETDKFAADAIVAGSPLIVVDGQLAVPTEENQDTKPGVVVGYALEEPVNGKLKFMLA